jgi:DNA polymerase-1
MRLHLVDANGWIFRAFFALPPMERSDGFPTGAVHGFCSMLWRMLQKHEWNPPTHVACVFDAGGDNHRHEMFPSYKAHRKPIDEALLVQLPIIRQAASAFNVAVIEKRHVEADDLIATYTRQFAEAGGEVVILSSDKDLMQLVGGPVSMLRPAYGKDKAAGSIEHIGPAEVEAKFGVPPERVADALALIGDASDNIPGVRGIGEKGAAKLIQQFGDLDTLLFNLARVEPPRIRNMLIDGMNNARLSMELVKLKSDIDVPPYDEFARRPIDCDRLCSFLQEMEFETLASWFFNRARSTY